MKRAGLPELGAVALALVLVLSAGAYGIMRGLREGSKELTIQGMSDPSGDVCRSRTAHWIPVVNQVTLPSQLPEGVSLATACYSNGLIRLDYTNEHRDKFLAVGMVDTHILDTAAPEGVPIQLGNLVGYTNEAPQPDGTRFYDIRFEEHGWFYAVAAQIAPENRVTAEELNAVALSRAEQ